MKNAKKVNQYQYRAFVSSLAMEEQKGVSVSVGNVRELVGLVADKVVEDPKFISELIRVGLNRKKKREK